MARWIHGVGAGNISFEQISRVKNVLMYLLCANWLYYCRSFNNILWNISDLIVTLVTEEGIIKFCIDHRFFIYGYFNIWIVNWWVCRNVLSTEVSVKINKSLLTISTVHLSPSNCLRQNCMYQPSKLIRLHFKLFGISTMGKNGISSGVVRKV